MGKRLQPGLAGVIFALCSISALAETVATDPAKLPPLATFQECAACPEMIVVPMGTFIMGGPPGESRNPFDAYGEGATGRRRGPDEGNIIPAEHPRHRVEMDIPYAISRNKTTDAEWIACVDAGGCSQVPDHRVLMPGGYRALGPNHPAVNVSYLDTLEYVAWLNAQVGEQVYRLPTEAEWEYAARAGTETPFAQGEALTADQANFSRKATENLLGVPMPDLQDRYLPVPVNELEAANAWGVRHMSGNVYELTQSCWSDLHIGLSNDSAYLANSEAQSACRRVGKGGANTTAMNGLRPAARIRPTEDRRRDFLGFRVVRETHVTTGL
jgi:formylglycine-generating enzyme required for sulfatase activity